MIAFPRIRCMCARSLVPRLSFHCGCPSSWTHSLSARRLGTRVDWAVALHAYGDPAASDWAARAPFQGATLADTPRIIAYQAAKLAEARAAGGAAGNAGAAGGVAPQELLAASEQGWSNPPATARAPLPQTRMVQGDWLC